MDAFVLTIVGRDRTGLVDLLAAAVAEHGGSWERSHVTELSGWFAGVVAVRVPADRAAAFEAALPALREEGLDVGLRRAGPEVPGVDGERVDVRVVGADRVGIVREISALLAALGVGIVDLQTWTEPAAMAGGELFRMAAALALPPGLTRTALVEALEELADDLMVDVADDRVAG